VITYTTLYREGGAELTLAAETLSEAFTERGERVALFRVESKADWVEVFHTLNARGDRMSALYFFGHSGMYGPMFRSIELPEQLSPHEWRALVGTLPFTEDGEAFFHACRTARWFAPFFARTFGVPCSGFHEYTTFSSDPERFRWPGRSPKKPLYLMGCRGRKSGGVWASVRKYLGGPLERPKRFTPRRVGEESTYARVAELYDEVFRDIRVRRDEWAWLTQAIQGHVSSASLGAQADGLRVVDLGCGNGALLGALCEEGLISQGLGLDSSPQMIARARARRRPHPQLDFEVVSSPKIPVEDASVDLAVSLLSWRYLDWDPLMLELTRVIKPGGRLLVVDMVTAPPALHQLPALLIDALRAHAQRWTRPRYREALKRLTTHPSWAEMLLYNPIRARHELVWYFESRFKGRRVETINVGRRAQVLAFDSGPIDPSVYRPPQSYP